MKINRCVKGRWSKGSLGLRRSNKNKVAYEVIFLLLLNRPLSKIFADGVPSPANRNSICHGYCHRFVVKNWIIEMKTILCSVSKKEIYVRQDAQQESLNKDVGILSNYTREGQHMSSRPYNFESLVLWIAATSISSLLRCAY